MTAKIDHSEHPGQPTCHYLAEHLVQGTYGHNELNGSGIKV